jgi:hypothetical protein
MSATQSVTQITIIWMSFAAAKTVIFTCPVKRLQSVIGTLV